MKAEERKEIETNSLAKVIVKAKEHLGGRTLYYVGGSIALVVAVVLLWKYFSREVTRGRDARLIQIELADTPEKLKTAMDELHGTVFSSIAKMHLARRALGPNGLEKLGTDRPDDRKAAAASVEVARTYFLEQTKELKEKEEPALLQEAWIGAAQAEESLVGLPSSEGGSDSRGDADRAIEYYEKAASIFPDSEGSGRFKKWSEELRSNKDAFIAAQRELYKPREIPPVPPKPTGPVLKDPPAPEPKKTEPAPKTPVPEPQKIEPPPKTGVPEPKKVTPPAQVEPPKVPDPKPPGEPKAK